MLPFFRGALRGPSRNHIYSNMLPVHFRAQNSHRFRGHQRPQKRPQKITNIFTLIWGAMWGAIPRSIEYSMPGAHFR